jgi:hypothetical protein
MDTNILMQIMRAMPPELLGKMVAEINAKNIPQDDMFESRPEGQRGIPIQVPKLQSGVYKGSIYK